DLCVDWIASQVLSAEQLEKYKAVRRAAWRENQRALDAAKAVPAQSESQRARAKAEAEARLREGLDAAGGERRTIPAAPARAAVVEAEEARHKLATAPALARYLRTRDDAFEKYRAATAVHQAEHDAARAASERRLKVNGRWLGESWSVHDAEMAPARAR